jgi:putative oxygen-independent coproporphyrinogen III oxidase
MSSFGVYVHIPFCRARCDYCAFATWTDRHHLHDSYLDALATDIDRLAGQIPAAGSVFVGGGTPSLVDPRRLVGVLSRIRLTPAAEVTVECNPDDVTDELAEVYAAGGVTRVSMGVQSTDPSVLTLLGRAHVPIHVERGVDSLRRAGLHVNLDLIYGSVGESLDSWRRTIAGVVALAPDHVSAYGLTVEAGTPLALTPERFPDGDDQADKYELADEALSAAGYANYEISNWAKPGHECRHNQLYWDQGDYVGIGCAAHSHQHGRRWWNVRTPERYIDAVTRGESTEASSETLDAEAMRIERLQLALRTRRGVPTEALDADPLGDLIEPGGDGLVLTRRGRLLANEIAVRLR